MYIENVPGLPFSLDEAIHWLEDASFKYYNGKAIVSDEEYDMVRDAVCNFAPNHVFFKKVKKQVRLNKEIILETPSCPLFRIENPSVLGVQESSNLFAKMRGWVGEVSVSEKTVFFCRPSYVGVRVALYYRGGRLIKASTMGDGYAGVDVTSRIKDIEKIPNGVPVKNDCEIKGVVVLRNKNFKRIQAVKTKYSNVRYAVLGILFAKKKNLKLLSMLDFAFDDIIFEGKRFALDENVKFERAKTLGFEDVGVMGQFFAKDVKDVEGYYRYLQSVRKAEGQNFNLLCEDVRLDGIILSLNDSELQKMVGSRENHLKYSILVELEKECQIVKIYDINWRVNKHGLVKPILILDGAKVYLDSFKVFQDNLLSFGGEVAVLRTVKGYLKLLGVVKRGAAVIFEHPLVCPCCKESLFSDDKDLICQNPACVGRVTELVFNYCETVSAGINCISKEFLREVVVAGLIKDVSDLYTLRRAALLSIKGARKRSVDAFLAVIEQSKKMPLDKFIYALSIYGVGEASARKIAKKLKFRAGFLFLPNVLSYKIYMDFIAKKDMLCRISSKTANQFCIWFSVPENQKMLLRLKKCGLELLCCDNNSYLCNKRFCISGGTDIPRKELIFYFNYEGYTYVDKVEQGIDLLICNVNNNSLKQKNAEKYNIPIMTEIEAISKLLCHEKIYQSYCEDVLLLDKEKLKDKAEEMIKKSMECNIFEDGDGLCS